MQNRSAPTRLTARVCHVGMQFASSPINGPVWNLYALTKTDEYRANKDVIAISALFFGCVFFFLGRADCEKHGSSFE